MRSAKLTGKKIYCLPTRSFMKIVRAIFCRDMNFIIFHLIKNCDLEKFRALVLSKLYKINVGKKMMMAIFGTVFDNNNSFTSLPERIEIAKFCQQITGKKIYLRTYKTIHEKVLFDFILPQLPLDEKTLWFLSNNICIGENVSYVFENKKIKEKNILQFNSQPTWVRENVPAIFVSW